MMNSLGPYLRQARENARLTRDGIAQITKITRTAVAALEEERFEALPQPVFVRGFIRAYAAAVHSDPQPALERYAGILAARATSRDRSLAESALSLTATTTRPHRGFRISHILLLVAAAVTFLVAYLLVGTKEDPAATSAEREGNRPNIQQPESPVSPSHR